MNEIINKSAFQWDAYRLLVDRIPSCTVQGGSTRGVCPGMSAEGSASGPAGGEGIPTCNRADTPSCGQTDTCDYITISISADGNSPLLAMIALSVVQFTRTFIQNAILFIRQCFIQSS